MLDCILLFFFGLYLLFWGRWTHSVVLVQSVPCLRGNGCCEKQGCFDSGGEVHLEDGLFGRWRRRGTVLV